MATSLSLTEGLLKALGVRILKKGSSRKFLTLPKDFEEEHVCIYRQVEPFTMTRPERVYALIEAVKYLVRSDIEGDFVECGVWRGGSIMAMALTLNKLAAHRSLHLFDTFAGMTAPTEEDVSVSGEKATSTFARKQLSEGSSNWVRSTLKEVKENVFSSGYDRERFHFYEGRVEDTLPGKAPERIALLRLDTDFYESTRHELNTLYPRLVSGGVLIVDDYGHWQGSRKAVDDYIREQGLSILLNRIDFAGRIAVKP